MRDTNIFPVDSPTACLGFLYKALNFALLPNDISKCATSDQEEEDCIRTVISRISCLVLFVMHSRRDMEFVRRDSEFELPGFRFHPTEEELLDFYLRGAVHGKKLNFDVISTLNIYHHDPWELPGLAKIGEREWYFFVVRNRKSSNGGRPNRTTERGFWKATGSDRPVRSAAGPKRLVGLKKTLVFYKGRAPRGTKTDWVMNEYRLPDCRSSGEVITYKEDVVLCKIYRKATSLKELEQRAAMEDDAKILASSQGCSSLVASTSSSTSDQELYQSPPIATSEEFHVYDHNEKTDAAAARMVILMEEMNKEVEVTSTLVRPPTANLQELQVPKFNLEWMQDPFWTQLCSPWLDPFYANMLNF